MKETKINAANFSNVNIIDENTTYIGNNVKFGSNITIHPNVVIYDDCSFGDNVEIMPFSIIDKSAA